MGKSKKKKKKVITRPKPSDTTGQIVNKIDDVTIEVVPKGEKLKNSSGRFEPKYRDEYCEMLIDHMSKGYTFSSFGAEILVGRQTLYDWADNYPDFMQAKEIGITKRQRFLEAFALASMKGNKEINAVMNMFLLKTGYHQDFGERVKHTHVDAVTAKIEEESENSNQVLVQLAYKV